MSYANLTEAVSALKKGDQSAFQEVYDGSVRYVYYTIFKSVSDRDLADDILQETYIEIYKNISLLKEPEAFKGWAAVIAQNKISRYFRKKSESVFSSEDEMEAVLDGMEEEDTAMLPEDAADNRETQRLIMEIIDSLPDTQKEAVISFYYNQMTISEIAGALEVPENTVKTWLSRGKKKIKEEIVLLAEKHGTKLYAAPLMLVLSGIFTKEAEACELPGQAFMLISTELSAGGVLGAAGSTTGAAGTQTAAAAVTKGATVAAGTAVKAAGVNWGFFAAVGLAVGIAGAGTAVGLNLAVQNSSEVEAEINEVSPEGNNLFGGVSDLEEDSVEASEDNELFFDSGSGESTVQSEDEQKEDKKKKKDKDKDIDKEKAESGEDSEAAELPSEEVIPEAEDVYEIPEVIKNLEKRDDRYYLGNDWLWYTVSDKPIEDKGDYYEIPEVHFDFFDSNNTDPDEDYPLTDKGFDPVTVRVRKTAHVMTDSMSLGVKGEYDSYEMSAVEYYSKTGLLASPTDNSTISVIEEFDQEGYVTKIYAGEHD